MSFAFGHLFGAWTLGKAYVYFAKKKISHYGWFFLLLGGILPDIDLVLDWVFRIDLHRTFTHSILFLFTIPLLTYLLFSILRHEEKRSFAVLLGAGISMHLFLDSFFGYGVPLLWPKLIYFSIFSGIASHSSEGSFLLGTVDTLHNTVKLTILDMAIGTAWIFYLWFRKRIQF
ncbi:MAG: metal-dependent hydrolase [Nanoarchaeota archaeon]